MNRHITDYAHTGAVKIFMISRTKDYSAQQMAKQVTSVLYYTLSQSNLAL